MVEDDTKAVSDEGRLTRRDVVLAGYSADRLVIESARRRGSPNLRSAALRAARRTGHLDADMIEHALDDDDPGVRRTAIDLARWVRPTRSIVSLIDDDDARVAEVAAFVLGELDPPDAEATTALSRIAADHSDSLVREAAVASLGAIGEPDGLPAILRACRDIAPVRRRAAIALAAYDDDAAEEQLRELLSDRDRHVRQIAGDLIELSAPEGTE